MHLPDIVPKVIMSIYKPVEKEAAARPAVDMQRPSMATGLAPRMVHRGPAIKPENISRILVIAGNILQSF